MLLPYDSGMPLSIPDLDGGKVESYFYLYSVKMRAS